MDSNILSACLYSFLVVFLLLGVLAVIIRLVTGLFPSVDRTVPSMDGAALAKDRTDDAPVIAAIHAAAASVYPDARVTRIEEIRQ